MKYIVLTTIYLANEIPKGELTEFIENLKGHLIDLDSGATTEITKIKVNRIDYD